MLRFTATHPSRLPPAGAGCENAVTTRPACASTQAATHAIPGT